MRGPIIGSLKLTQSGHLQRYGAGVAFEHSRSSKTKDELKRTLTAHSFTQPERRKATSCGQSGTVHPLAEAPAGARKVLKRSD